jgi:Glycosyl transferases group 1
VNIVVVSSMLRIATANYLVSALRRAGHTLMVLSDVPAAAVDVVCGPATDIARVCAARGFTADFVFFIEDGSMQLLPTGLERMACPTAWYAIDSHTRFSGHACISRLFDVTFVAHKQYVDRLSLEGARQARWLPVAFPAELLVKSPRERVWDIAFVGSVDKTIYPQRAELLAKLVRACGPAAVGPADPHEMIERYAAAKIVLNNSAHHDLNMRYFEAMGSGAVLLTDAAIGSGAEELFEPGRHFVQYRDAEDLQSQFAALLRDPERRAAIGKAAQAIVLERHTYDYRVAALHKMAFSGRTFCAGRISAQKTLRARRGWHGTSPMLGTNGPTCATTPTKWIAVDDNGTIHPGLLKWPSKGNGRRA